MADYQNREFDGRKGNYILAANQLYQAMGGERYETNCYKIKMAN